MPARPTARTNEIRQLLGRYWPRLLLTYGLFNVENLLRLTQAVLLGWAINDLLKGSGLGLLALVLGHLAHLVVRTARQMVDSRAFHSIYTDRASRIVVQQRAAGVDVSTVAARSALSREFVDFLEHHVPMLIRGLYSIIGAVVILAWYDTWLVAFCAALAVPACILNWGFGRATLRISRLLHDQMEREVDVIRSGRETDVQDHYRGLARQHVKLSDWEALTAGAIELFVIGLLAGVLLRFCTREGVAAGDIFAVFRYVLMYIMALDQLPLLVQKLNRLRDIGRRIVSPSNRAADPSLATGGLGRGSGNGEAGPTGHQRESADGHNRSEDADVGQHEQVQQA